jgi:hypothetical protein
MGGIREEVGEGLHLSCCNYPKGHEPEDVRFIQP